MTGETFLILSTLFSLFNQKLNMKLTQIGKVELLLESPFFFVAQPWWATFKDFQVTFRPCH